MMVCLDNITKDALFPWISVTIRTRIRESLQKPKENGPKLGLLPVPLRSPPGAVRYLVWEQAFPLQRPRGALLAAEKTHWAACA